METAKVDLRKLQLLNDRITQVIDALNQLRSTAQPGWPQSWQSGSAAWQQQMQQPWAWQGQQAQPWQQWGWQAPQQQPWQQPWQQWAAAQQQQPWAWGWKGQPQPWQPWQQAAQPSSESQQTPLPGGAQAMGQAAPAPWSVNAPANGLSHTPGEDAQRWPQQWAGPVPPPWAWGGPNGAF